MFRIPVSPERESFISSIAVSLLGYLSVKISNRAEIPPLLEKSVARKKGLFLSILIGLAFGLLQNLMAESRGMKVPMVDWPLSIQVDLSAGVLSELLFPFIPLVLWLLSAIIWRISDYLLRHTIYGALRA